MPKSNSNNSRSATAVSTIEEIKVVVVGKICEDKNEEVRSTFIFNFYILLGDGYTGKVSQEK